MLEQYGVLAYKRIGDGELCFLLITSRDTKRWVIPRGNRIDGLSPWQSAAQEAFEEAGLTGIVATEEIGLYEYPKRRANGSSVPARVHVFPLRTLLQSHHWPERSERETGWFTRDEAIERVDESGLKQLFRSFVPPAEGAGRRRRPLVSLPPLPPSRSPMLNMFKGLMPKEARFFDMFERHAETLVGGAEVMSRMFAKEEDIEEACRQISNFEEQADGVTREVLHAVRRTFLTPFDRSAITDLISSMDDAIDEMQKTAKAITQFDVAHFEPQMRELASLAERGAVLVREALPLLRKVGSNGAALDQITEKIIHLEEEADNLHAAGLKDLYQRHKDGNAMGYIVGREIYSHLEKVLDRFEDVANEISGIVIDHA